MGEKEIPKSRFATKVQINQSIVNLSGRKLKNDTCMKVQNFPDEVVFLAKYFPLDRKQLIKSAQ